MLQAKLREAVGVREILGAAIEERRTKVERQVEDYEQVVQEMESLGEKVRILEMGIDRKVMKEFEDKKAVMEKVSKELDTVTKNLDIKGKARYRQVEFLKKGNEDLRKKVRDHENYISEQLRAIEELSFREEAMVLTREADKKVYTEEIDLLRRQCEEMEARIRLEQLQIELEAQEHREAKKKDAEVDPIFEQDEILEETKRTKANDPEYTIVKVDFNPEAKKAIKTDIQIDATEEWA